jgi:hypothetical protein
MALATTVSKKLVFIEYKPAEEDPSDSFLPQGASKQRITLADFLLEPKKISEIKVFFQKKDISHLVSLKSLNGAMNQDSVWRWGGPCGTYQKLYLFGPVLWFLLDKEVALPESDLIKLLKPLMPAWAQTIVSEERRISRKIQSMVYERVAS